MKAKFMMSEKKILVELDKKNISYKIYKHDALFTVTDSFTKRGNIAGVHSKNLFLKNKKNKFYLISCLENRKIDLKKLSKAIKLGNVSFAKEGDLFKYLGVLPGSVTPFGLLNDTDNIVEFFLDFDFLSSESVNFHPLVNTSTINLKVKDLIYFLFENKKKVNIFNFNNFTLLE